MYTRLVAVSSALVMGLAFSGYADPGKDAKDKGSGVALKTAEQVLNKLHKLNSKEIECAKLGQTKSENPQVLEYARMLEADHQKADEEVKSLATAKNVELKDPEIDEHDEHADHGNREGSPGDPGKLGTPGTPGVPGDAGTSDGTGGDRPDSNVGAPEKGGHAHKAHMKELEKLSGSEFDREYMSMMAMSHGKAIPLLTNSQETIEDADAKNLVSAQLPVLQKHWEEAAALSRQLGGNPDELPEKNPETAR